MNATRKVKLKDIKLNLTCKLCLGYLVDATTIIECLHSFCKSCIINYLEKSEREEKYCPVCDVQLHSTKPLTSIRSDLMLQEIVYKLVPGLFKNEMRRRREFYANNDGSVPTTPLDSGQVFDELYITSDDSMHLSLEYVTDDEQLKEHTKRYLKCPAAVSIFVLKKLLQGKYDLDGDANIDIMFGDRILPDDFLLMDVAYKYSWTKNGNKPLSLRYRIRGHKKPILRLERTINDAVSALELSKTTAQEESQSVATNKKKVCNENGSNIMPSEQTKPSEIKMPPNGLISEEVTIAPIKTPNGKIKGRKRKHLNYSSVIIENKDDIKNLAKRLKLEKATLKTSIKKHQYDTISLNAQTQVEITTINNNNNDSPNGIGHTKEANEVQLQISENGVMSAHSVSGNGSEKIIYDSSKRASATSSSNTSPNPSHDLTLTEKLLLSGKFHSKTGPTGVTEIICDKPDPISSIKTTSAKPGYVTLNIPTPKSPITSQNGRYQNNGNDASEAKKYASSQNGSPSPSTKVNEKLSINRSEILEKIRQKTAGKSAEGNDSSSSVTNGVGKFSNNVGTSMDSERQRTSGIHSLPIISPLSNSFQQQRSKPINAPGKPTTGKDNFTLPLALNFSPASGMSVSMIPCTSSVSVNGNNFSGTANGLTLQVTTTPPKRTAHPAAIVNGEPKHTISHKPILPKPNGNPIVSHQKPPKFFKSRRTSSPGTSPSSTLGNNISPASNKNEVNELKRKTPTSLMNGSSKNGRCESTEKKVIRERKEQPKETNQPTNAMDFLKLFSSGVLAANSCRLSTSSEKSASSSNPNDTSNSTNVQRTLPFQSQLNDKYSPQHLTALTNLTAANSKDVLNSGLGIAAVAAAAAAASNNGMVPFVTDNYCSFPYLNQRLPMAQFPFAYNNFNSTGYSVTGSNTNLTTATTTPVNSTKQKLTNSTLSQGCNSILNGLLSSNNATSLNENDKNCGSSLDLSLVRSTSASTASTVEKASDSNPLLVSLLNSSSSKSPKEKKMQGDSEATSPTNGHVKTPKSSEGTNSPLIKQLLEKTETPATNKATSPDVKEHAIAQDASNRSDRENGNANSNRLSECIKNGSMTKSQNASPSKPEITAENKVNKPSQPTNSPKLKNDNDSNISTGSSANHTLDKDRLLCLSAQNNNIHTMSNNHDKSIKTGTNQESDSSECSTISVSKESDNKVSSGGTELHSCT